MPIQTHATDMGTDAVNRAIARKMVDEWLRPSDDRRASIMEGLADASCTIIGVAMEAAEKRGEKFHYDA